MQSHVSGMDFGGGKNWEFSEEIVVWSGSSYALYCYLLLLLLRTKPRRNKKKTPTKYCRKIISLCRTIYHFHCSCDSAFAFPSFFTAFSIRRKENLSTEFSLLRSFRLTFNRNLFSFWGFSPDSDILWYFFRFAFLPRQMDVLSPARGW